MKLLITSPAKALNKAYFKQSLKREQIDHFKATLARLFEQIKVDESEEHLKNTIIEFLKDTWYKHTNEINTSGRADLVIYNGITATSSVGVLIEVKRPSNKNEMISLDRLNAKALHELLHYYMQERYIKNNTEIRHLIICNIHEWYIFDAVDFERFFFHNQKLVNSYKGWKEGTLPGMDTAWLYQEIIRPIIDAELEELPCTFFDLKEYERIVRSKAKTEDTKLLSLYKILSPAHLLKQSFTNDSNSLNKEFYSELLHIIGLEEVRDKGRKLIQRKQEDKRDPGSLLENACSILKSRNRLSFLSTREQYGTDEDDQYFGVGLELCITWLNRLLFLKLLEGQLIAYHKGDRSYAFLNTDLLKDFSDLNELFFDVLAVKIPARSAVVQSKFGKIPYLNSSLFEESYLEGTMVRIIDLNNRNELPVYGQTVLKTSAGKRRTGTTNTLTYMLEFLDAYDFGAEGTADIQEQNKSIINASVLGLIFEKINGYKDGSFFTPGFITMYICQETIRRAVVKRFNEAYEWSCVTITDLYNEIYRHKVSLAEANDLVNGLKICDPAVGSGHFLVSALNELIAVKSELRILASEDGKLLPCDITIENDELIVTIDDHIFEYNRKDNESQRIQETLFHEKETIIENCLFGVDINAKSVAICRLRLWIEMLKNAYYRKSSEDLETLPNIDINIKCGNSLISRFSLSGNTNLKAASKSKLKDLTEKYRKLVMEYKQSPENKILVRQNIEVAKLELENFGLPNDKDYLALRQGKEQLSIQSLFGFSQKELDARGILEKKMDALQKRFDEKKVIYRTSFEWRFEFPEILNEDGDFIGFDAIIGNPPYIRHEAIKDQKPGFKELFGSFYCGTADICTYFFKIGLNLLKTGSTLCYIAPNKFMRAGYGKNTRDLLVTQAKPLMVLDFGDLPIFEEATTYPAIILAEKLPAAPVTIGKKQKVLPPMVEHPGQFLTATFTDTKQLSSLSDTIASIGFNMPIAALRSEGWTLERTDVLSLMKKLRTIGKPLGKYVDGKFYYGIKTGLNEAFVIDEVTKARLIAEDPKSAEIIKPWLRGRDIRKWITTWERLYVIFTRKGTDIEQFPAIKRHLEQFKDRLLPKPVNWNNEIKWNGRKSGPYMWFEIQDNIAYFEEFEKTKIVYQEIATYQSFAYAEPGTFCNNKCFLIPGKNDFFLALLNSKLFWWYLGNLASGLVGGARAMQTPYMDQLPIIPATDAQQTPIIERVQKILAAPGSPDVPRLEAEIDLLIYELYGLIDKEIAIIVGRKNQNDAAS